MRLNAYRCDFCGKEVPIGEEYRMKVTHPIDKKTAEYSRSLAHNSRHTETIDLCSSCFEKKIEKYLM